MVKANGDPTRARDRRHTYELCRIDKAHRFIAAHTPNETLQRDQFVRTYKAAMGNLSPATQRVLKAVCRALFMSYDPKRGYTFAGSVNRAAIAHELGRSTLVPYDIRMLRNLAAKRLIVEKRRALPRKQYGDIWLGAGAEFVYSIPVDGLYCLLALEPNEQGRLSELSALSKPKPPQAEQRTALPRLPQNPEPYPSFYRQPVKPKKQSLLERIVDLLSW